MEKTINLNSEKNKNQKYYKKVTNGIFIKTVVCGHYKTSKYVASNFYKNLCNF